MKKLSIVRFRQPTPAPDDSAPQSFLANDYEMFLSDDGSSISIKHRKTGVTNLYPFASTNFVRVIDEPQVKK